MKNEYAPCFELNDGRTVTLNFTPGRAQQLGDGLSVRHSSPRDKQMAVLSSRMRNIDPSDPMKAHLLADALLCEALIACGQQDLVDAWANLRSHVGEMWV